MRNLIKKIYFKFLNLFEHHSIESDYTKRNLRNRNFNIGDYTYGVPSVIGGSEKNKLFIGKFCSFGSGVQLLLSANHHFDWVTTYPLSLIKGVKTIERESYGKGDIVIGNDVWVGNNVIILSGVKIGDGAVIGAGSIVTKDVAPYEIVAGNPARHIRFRFSKEKIDELLRLKWWNWTIDEIRSKTDFLRTPLEK